MALSRARSFGTCSSCNDVIRAGADSIATRTIGWSLSRSGGGANYIALPEPVIDETTGRVIRLCATCWATKYGKAAPLPSVPSVNTVIDPRQSTMGWEA